MANIQDRDAFKSFQATIHDLYNGGHTDKFYSRDYLWDYDDAGTEVLHIFTRGKLLDWIMIYSCISLYTNLTLWRATIDAQCYDTK